MSQAWVKKSASNSVKDIIFERFGMSLEEYKADMQKEYEIQGLEDVADALYKAVKEGMHIESANDYDVDGIMSSANMAIIKEIFAEAVGPVDMNIRVPRRFSEGFGLREEFTETLHDCVLITADNGVASIEAVKKAKENGCTVLITDHHEAAVDESGAVVLPDADVLVDPHVTGGEFVDYCGAGIVYKLAKICMEKYGAKIPDWKKEFLMDCAKVNAAVATVSDSVPMIKENAKIVKEGLDLYSKGRCSFALKMLANGFGHTMVTEGDIAMSEGPAINAYGRLEDDGSQKVANAMSFLGRYDEATSGLVQEMRTMNDIRKKQTNEVMKEMPDIIRDTGQEDSGIIVTLAGCNEGIAGIIAGRIASRYKKPAVVLVDAGDGLLKGSSRSIDGVDIKQILDDNMELLYKHGGHAAACGLTVEMDKFEDLINALHETLPLEFLPDAPDISYDLIVKNAKYLGKAHELIRDAGPYGVGNPVPVLLVKDVELDGNFKVMGAEANYCKVGIKGTPYEVFAGDDVAKFLIEEKPEKVDIVCTLSENIFRGKSTLQLSPIVMDHAGRDHSLNHEKSEIEI